MSPGPVTILLANPADSTEQWANLDIDGIVAQLKATGVVAPADQVPGLAQVVARADADGNDLFVVVLEEHYTPFTVYRDIATEIHEQTGGTVLVLGPGSSIGTASSDFSRVQLEDGTSGVKHGTDTVTAVDQIYGRAADPYLDWTLVTVVLVIVVVIGAVIARYTGLRRRRSGIDAPSTDGAADTAESAVVGTESD